MSSHRRTGHKNNSLTFDLFVTNILWGSAYLSAYIHRKHLHVRSSDMQWKENSTLRSTYPQSIYKNVHFHLKVHLKYYRLFSLSDIGAQGDQLRYRYPPQLIPTQSIPTPISLQNFTYQDKTTIFLLLCKLGKIMK